MGILNFLKILLVSIYPEALLKDVTPENIEKLKAKLRPLEYKKWIRTKLTLVTGLIEERKQKGLVIPPEMIIKQKLLQKEL